MNKTNNNPFSKDTDSDLLCGEKDLMEKFDRQVIRHRLERAVICSNKENAARLQFAGLSPLWTESPLRELKESDIQRISKYVEKIYYIPDFDMNSLDKARKIAFQFIELYVVFPSEEDLKSVFGEKNKPVKNIHDWMDLHDTLDDLEKLLQSACPLKFWSENSRRKIEVSSPHLFYFLAMHGFYKYRDKFSGQVMPVQILDYAENPDSHIVRKVGLQDVRDYLLRWMEGLSIPSEQQDAIINNPRTTVKSLADLKVRDFDFTDCTKDTQSFTFNDTTYQVSKDGYKILSYAEMNYVWEDKIIHHKFSPTNDELFTFRRLHPPFNGEPYFDVKPGTNMSKVQKIFFNQSDIYWQKRDEKGEQLTPDEMHELGKSYQSMLFNIGYLLHDFKNYSKPWYVLHQDWLVSRNPKEANGRNGKSFARQFLTKVAGKKIGDIKLNKHKATEYQHLFGSIDPDIDIIFVDEVPSWFDYDTFNEETSTGINVNPKGKPEYHIPYEYSPKILINTNFVPMNPSASCEGRRVNWITSDYYHQHTQYNDYESTRTIYDEFDQLIFGADYTEEDWNRDLNFMLQCEVFYFYVQSVYNDKLNPPMSNINRRKAIASLPAGFDDFATEYFEADEHFDQDVSKINLMSEYNCFAKPQDRISARNLKDYLKIWCEIYGHVFNPQDKCNSSDRRIRRNGIEYFHIRK